MMSKPHFGERRVRVSQYLSRWRIHAMLNAIHSAWDTIRLLVMTATMSFPKGNG